MKFIPYKTKDNDVFCCVYTKWIETIQKKNLKCIIGLPIHKKLLNVGNTPFVLRPYLFSYILDLAEIWKTNFKAKTICISGSVGKTTTTEMIGGVLEPDLKVYRATGSQNTEIRICQFVFELKKDIEIYIQECSGSFSGQLEKSSRVLHPDIFVLTNVGSGHIGNFRGNIELLLYEKLALDRNASDNGIGVINWDNELLKKANYQHRIIKCAIYDKTADFIAENIVEKNGTIEFDIVENGRGNVRTKILLNVPGIHNVYNAMSAFAVGLLSGVSRENIARNLSSYKTSRFRQNLVQLNGTKVYLDCYNASKESINAALSTVDNIEALDGKKKIAVIGDVAELGVASEKIHREIGELVSKTKSVDEVIFYGPNMRFSMEEASKNGICCRHTEDRNELRKWLEEKFLETGLILFKGSHVMALHRTVDDLYGTDYYAYDSDGKIICDEMGNYKRIENYGCVLIKVNSSNKTITVPEFVDGLYVRILGRGVFQGKAVERIVLPNQLRCISAKSLFGCKMLKRIGFPKSLKYIGQEAFYGCESLEEVDLSRGCSTIESNAFKNCKNLKKVILPESLKTINDTAFDENADIVICCPHGSYAEKWATERNFKVHEI
ncbi:Mur ligase family protein [Selenomonas sp. KH1T6]|uniref:Mur ligase family protein n=1 Tax=Selenomonas sp. KH1T6 TaxID=3158784 RepID=UPI001114D238